ncbi:MAG: transcriptional repressor [Bergeyella sp.]
MKTHQIENILSQKKIPATSMRILVLNEFLKTDKAVSLSELEEHLEHCDRSTIYRTLKTFEKKGVIHGIQENNTTQYLLCHDNCDEIHHHDYHLHFYCTECKKTICLDEIRFENISFPEDYDIKELKFLANGICRECKNNI